MPLDADGLKQEIKDLLDGRTLDAGLDEAAGLALSIEACRDAAEEYEMRLGELGDDEG